MNDEENKTADQLAAEINAPQIAQVADTESTAQSPATAPATSDEPLIFGKFKSLDDADRAYKELERDFHARRQVERTPVSEPKTPAPAQFDPEIETGISSIVERELAKKEALVEVTRANKFAADHAEELKDPLLRGAVSLEIREANERGEYMEPETALANAKKSLDARLVTRVDEAKKESFTEGQDLARRKRQADAIGGTSKAAPDVNPDALSAEEYAEWAGFERSF